MEYRQVKQLVELFEKSSLSIMKLEEGEFKLHLERPVAVLPQSAATCIAGAAPALPKAPSLAVAEQSVDFNNIIEVRSPMVGVFYEASSPEAEPFVRRGSRVKKGDVLCIIEAMKLMNEILAEVDGEIVDICAGDGQIVEFSQVLFKIF